MMRKEVPEPGQVGSNALETLLRSHNFPTCTPIELDTEWVSSIIFGLGEKPANAPSEECTHKFRVLMGLITVPTKAHEKNDLFQEFNIKSPNCKKQSQCLLGGFWDKIFIVIRNRHQIDVCPTWLSWHLFGPQDCIVTPHMCPCMAAASTADGRHSQQCGKQHCHCDQHNLPSCDLMRLVLCTVDAVFAHNNYMNGTDQAESAHTVLKGKAGTGGVTRNWLAKKERKQMRIINEKAAKKTMREHAEAQVNKAPRRVQKITVSRKGK